MRKSKENFSELEFEIFMSSGGLMCDRIEGSIKIVNRWSKNEQGKIQD